MQYPPSKLQYVGHVALVVNLLQEIKLVEMQNPGVANADSLEI